MNKYITEFIGTLFLVLTIGGCVIVGGGAGLPPLAIGSILMVMIYAGGHISGGHDNPAVTLGVWIRGRCPNRDVVPYWAAQLLGAVVAVIVALLRSDIEPKLTLLKRGQVAPRWWRNSCSRLRWYMWFSTPRRRKQMRAIPFMAWRLVLR
jgi:hypothetical protein